MVRIRVDSASPGVAPTADAVDTGAYPLTQPMYLFVRNHLRGPTKVFVEWIVSTEGQREIAQTNYFPASSGRERLAGTESR